MDKNRFRNISFCAIGALLALALVQAWSLWRMYADRAEEFSRKVTLAMNRAAYDDLLIGNRRRTSQTRTSVVTTGNIDSVKLDMIDTISVKSLGAAGKVLSIRSKVDTLRTNIALRRGDKTRYIYQEVRMPSFTALQFNLSRYDSLLTRYLADAGIGLPYSVDVIRGRDGGDVAEIRLDSLAARTTGAEREEAVIASQKDAPQIRNPKVFTSRVTTDDKLLFRVKIENPHRELLRHPRRRTAGLRPLPAGAGDQQGRGGELFFAAHRLRRACHRSQSGGLSGPLRRPCPGKDRRPLGADLHGPGRRGGADGRRP